MKFHKKEREKGDEYDHFITNTIMYIDDITFLPTRENLFSISRALHEAGAISIETRADMEAHFYQLEYDLKGNVLFQICPEDVANIRHLDDDDDDAELPYISVHKGRLDARFNSYTIVLPENSGKNQANIYDFVQDMEFGGFKIVILFKGEYHNVDGKIESYFHFFTEFNYDNKDIIKKAFFERISSKFDELLGIKMKLARIEAFYAYFDYYFDYFD